MQQSPKNYDLEQSEENVFNEILFKFLPYWPLFLLLLVTSIGAAWLYLSYKVPVYASTATVLIKDEQKGLDASNVLDALDMFSDKKIVDNEIQVLSSRTLRDEVAKSLYLYAPIIQEGSVVDKSAYLTSPVKIEVKDPDQIHVSKDQENKMYFTYDSIQRTVTLDNKKIRLAEWVTTPYGTLRFLSNDLYTPAIEPQPLYFSLYDMNDVTDDLFRRLTVAASSKQSTVINLIFNDEVPQRGRDVLNALITEYNEAAINDKNIQATNTLAFVEDRLKYVVHELDSVEGQIEHFKSRNHIVDISAQGQLYLQSVGVNDQKISDFSVQLAVLDKVENYVLGKEKTGNIVPSTLGVTDPVLSQLLQKLYEAEIEYERLKKTTAENNPMLISLSDQISKMRPSILENIQNQRKSLEAGRDYLNTTSNRYASMLQTIPEKERELLGISRQQTIKNNIYTFLLQKREEAALSQASAVADSRLIDKAYTNKNPVSPNRMITYLIAFVGAFGFGIGLITFKDLINRNVQSRAEIEKYTAMPILGEVAYDNTKSTVVIGEGKRTYIAEQFRQLRTSLGYMGINSRKKKILVTSSISGEGKSFVSTNLSISLALMGKKVVLVELDLRKPKISEGLNVSRAVGLTNYLIDEKEETEIIKGTSINNLYVIPSGPIPPNPSELILNGKIQELFNYLETSFDYIIIDTAPVSPVTDAYILSPLCDATLYVIRHGYTPRIFIQKLDEQSRIRNLKNMALIFNGVQGRGFSKYGYGYGYGYSYGYTQEENGSKKKKGIRKSDKTV